MNIKNFDPDDLIATARKNIHSILERELECGVPINYCDESGQYVFRYKDGTVLPASLDISFQENWDRHKELMRKTSDLS